MHCLHTQTQLLINSDVLSSRGELFFFLILFYLFIVIIIIIVILFIVFYHLNL